MERLKNYKEALSLSTNHTNEPFRVIDNGKDDPAVPKLEVWNDIKIFEENSLGIVHTPKL